MAKRYGGGSTIKKGDIQTQYSGCQVPVPSAKGATKGSSFGSPLSEGPSPTQGIMGEVQYSELHRGKGGGKVSGS